MAAYILYCSFLYVAFFLLRMIALNCRHNGVNIKMATREESYTYRAYPISFRLYFAVSSGNQAISMFVPYLLARFVSFSKSGGPSP
jgi:hypothetical protein